MATRASSSCPRTRRSAAHAPRASTPRCFPASPPRTAWSQTSASIRRVNGLQSYEAGDFLHRRPAIEPTTALVLVADRRRGRPNAYGKRLRSGAGGARGAPARALPGRPQSSGVRGLVLSRSRADRPRPAARRAWRGQGHPRVNAVRAASSSLSARARRAATTFPFASKSCCARTAASRPSSASPAAACASASASSASAANTGESVVPASSTAAVRDLFRLPATAELGESLRARDAPRDLRVDIVGRGRLLARERGGERLLGTALRVQRLGELRGDRSKIRALSDLLELLQRGTKLALRCAGISGQQLDRARPRRDRSSADAAAERVEDLLPFAAARARLVELAGHRGEQARRDEQEPLGALSGAALAISSSSRGRPRSIGSGPIRVAKPSRTETSDPRRGSSARRACSSARSRVSSIGPTWQRHQYTSASRMSKRATVESSPAASKVGSARLISSATSSTPPSARTSRAIIVVASRAAIALRASPASSAAAIAAEFSLPPARTRRS